MSGAPKKPKVKRSKDREVNMYRLKDRNIISFKQSTTGQPRNRNPKGEVKDNSFFLLPAHEISTIPSSLSTIGL